MGWHRGGILNELEFFHRSYKELEVSFEEFQKHFEAAFGKPTNERPGDQGLPSFCWNFTSVQIVHYVLDRFRAGRTHAHPQALTATPNKSLDRSHGQRLSHHDWSGDG